MVNLCEQLLMGMYMIHSLRKRMFTLIMILNKIFIREISVLRKIAMELIYMR